MSNYDLHFTKEDNEKAFQDFKRFVSSGDRLYTMDEMVLKPEDCALSEEGKRAITRVVNDHLRWERLAKLKALDAAKRKLQERVK